MAWVGAGRSHTFYEPEGTVLRFNDTYIDWNNILFDESYTVGSDCEQSVTVNTDYCNQPAGCGTKTITVTNTGTCDVDVREWLPNGDIYLAWLGAGRTQTFYEPEGTVLRFNDTYIDLSLIHI